MHLRVEKVLVKHLFWFPDKEDVTWFAIFNSHMSPDMDEVAGAGELVRLYWDGHSGNGYNETTGETRREKEKHVGRACLINSSEHIKPL